MDPTLTWIDASEVRAALAHVRRAGQPRKGAAAPQPSPQQDAKAPSIQAPLAPLEPLREPSTVAARIDALAGWIERNLRPRRWFLADDQGLPICDFGFGEARIGELTHWMRQWRPGGRPTTVEAVTYHLNGGRQLIAMWVSTQVGATAIAVESPVHDDIATIRRAVEYALKGNMY